MSRNEIDAMARSIGLIDLTADELARLAALVANTDAQVARLPRLAKHAAPAQVFVVPAPREP